MRIALDATSVPEQPAGAGVYAIELTRALVERHPAQDGYLLFARGAWPYEIVAERKNWRIERPAVASRAGRLAWEQARLPGRLSALGIDVLHSTHHTLPLFGVRCRRVVTVHDVTFFRIPKRYPALRRLYMQTLTRHSARIADAIIVPSNAVRTDVITRLRVHESRVTTVYEAAGPNYQPVEPAVAAEVAARYGMTEPFLLSVGSMEPGKNRPRLLRAIRRAVDAGSDLRLLVAGQPAWRYEGENALVRELGLGDRVRFAGYVPAADLPALYSAAQAFVFPSLYEGFGLPVIEAMACGTPVLTSDRSATSEVAGDAAVLVDPYSIDAIAGGLARLASDPALRADLGARGLSRAAAFSWRRAADETHAVYRRVLDAGAGA